MPKNGSSSDIDSFDSELTYSPFNLRSTLNRSHFIDCYNLTKEQYVAESPKFSALFAIGFGIPASIIIVVTILGNFLVLCMKARLGKRQTTLLIWNLGLADFLVGIMVLPIGVAYVISQKWPFGKLMCRIWTSCDVVFCTASIVTLCVISVDRYIGVTRPLKYKTMVTKNRIYLAICGIWVFSIGILLGTINYGPSSECSDPYVCHVAQELKYVVHSVITAFFFPAIITLALYWKIYWIARKRETILEEGLLFISIQNNFLQACVASEPMRIHCGKQNANQQHQAQNQQKLLKMHKRVARTLGVVVSAFLCCWLPFFSLYLLAHHCESCVPSLLLDVLSWLGYCNSMINPIIYAFTVDEFKDSLKALTSLEWKQVARNRKHVFKNDPATVIPRSQRAYSLLPDQIKSCSIRAGANTNKLFLQQNRIIPENGTSESGVTNGVIPPASGRPKLTKTGQLFPTSVMRPGEIYDPGRRTWSAARIIEEENNNIWSAKAYAMLINPHTTVI